MDDDNDDQGLRLDTGSYVEDARDYDPEDPDPDQSDESLVDKVKNALGGDDGANGIDGEDDPLTGDGDELDEEDGFDPEDEE